MFIQAGKQMAVMFAWDGFNTFQRRSFFVAVVAKRQSYWTAFSTSGDRFLKESRTFRG